ncbi:MAG: autotransporter outer membrane beta-barrel domain-containing protein [Opitutaceae bacterium]|nr:autotransporter outer membrane beta-barrel domain-containing protein [Opitutaceae bacterium]
MATWSGVISGSHSLTKTGDGTLVLAGANDYTSGTVIAGGTLAGSTATLQGRITNNAALVFDQQAASGDYSGTVTGGGKVFKTGTGGLTLTGRIEAGEFNIDGGAVSIGGGNPIATTTAFNIGSSGSLRGTGTLGGGATRFLNRGALYVGQAAGQTGHGTLTLHGDYTGEAAASLTLAVIWEQGTVIDADKLVISGSASGRTIIKLTGTSAIGQTAAPGADELVVAQGGSSENAFELDQLYVSGIYEMGLRNDGGTWSLVANEIAPDVPAVMGVDASALFIGKASMESLGKRFTATRSLNAPRRFGLWMNGLYREDNISDTAYAGTESHTAGVQVGGDWSLALGGTGRLTLGLFYDYARTDMTLPFADSSTETESHGFGGYAAYKIGAWFVNGLFRLGREDYTVNLFRTPAFVMEGDSWAASIEAGRVFEVDSRWKVEPQVQLSWQGHGIDDVTDKFGRTFVVNSLSSFDARAGVRLWEEYQWKPGLLLTPYARLGAAYEFKGRGRVTVAGTPFENDLSGLNGLFDAGLAMQLGKGLSLHLDGTWYLGRKLDGYSVNLGAALAW